MEGICIANKHGEVLFFSEFQPNVNKALFTNYLSEIISSADSPPFTCTGCHEFTHIYCNNLYWCCCIKSGCFLSKCGPLALVDNLFQFQKICESFLGIITQYSISTNLILLREIVIETMNGGYMQVQNIDKLRSQIYCSVNSPKESSILNVSPGLFGLEKSAPTTASQQSILSITSSKKELYVDVIERICATVSPDGTLLRVEVSGSIRLKCFLLNSPSLILSLNSRLNVEEGFSFNPTVQLSEVEFGEGVDCDRLESKRELRVVTKPGETDIVKYNVSPLSLQILPFNLEVSVTQLTHSDAELKLKLSSNTSMGTTAPNVTVLLKTPSCTSGVMSRTNGPKNQTVSFTKDDGIVWKVTDFPGGSYAQAFIRLVDSGENVSITNAQLEFEVSKWVCSGLRIENVRLQPRQDGVTNWVRYLTSSDSVTFLLK